MDQLQKRMGRKTISYEELVDELEYNFRRKEELKKDLEKLDKENDDLRLKNFTNAKVQMATLSENNELKETIDNLRKEIKDLRASNEDDQLEICLLRDKNKYLKEENVDNEKKLQTVNQNLLIRIKSILKCDECEKSFKDKASIKAHFLSEHSEFKCDDCEKKFEEKAALISHIFSEHLKNRFKCEICEIDYSRKVDLNIHVQKEHIDQSRRNLIFKGYDEMASSLRNQKTKLYQDIYRLKQQEIKQKGKCICKGSYCAINHSRFRWTFSNADEILNKLTSMSTNTISCDQCDKRFKDKNEIESHKKIVHEEVPKSQQCNNRSIEESHLTKHIESLPTDKMVFLCHDCEQTFTDENTFRSHRETQHLGNLLENTFCNPSLFISNDNPTDC